MPICHRFVRVQSHWCVIGSLRHQISENRVGVLTFRCKEVCFLFLVSFQKRCFSAVENQFSLFEHFSVSFISSFTTLRFTIVYLVILISVSRMNFKFGFYNSSYFQISAFFQMVPRLLVCRLYYLFLFVFDFCCVNFSFLWLFDCFY